MLNSKKTSNSKRLSADQAFYYTVIITQESNLRQKLSRKLNSNLLWKRIQFSMIQQFLIVLMYSTLSKSILLLRQQGLPWNNGLLALSAMGSNFNSQQFHAPNSSMENSSSASTSGNKGGGNRGAPSNKGGRGGGTGPRQGGANRSSNPGRQKPLPNRIHNSGKEEWHPPQSLIATWTGTKPVPDMLICYYCALPNHTT